jgi:ABC-type multidrug transport system ATPase subunit
MNIELVRLTKRYGGTPALQDVNWRGPGGRVVAVIGLNGAGKTTLLRTLGGVVAPTKGEVRYDGEKFHRGRIDQRRRLLLLPDFPLLYGEMNVLQHAAMMLRVYERDSLGAEEAILRALEELDLMPLAEVPLAQLSRGQIYKSALVGLRAVAPELWLLDEPFASGLDPQGLAVLKDWARAHAAQGGTVVYSTQILEIAERFCDELLVMDEGRLVSTYSRAELAALPATGPESLEMRLRQFREGAS